MTIISWIIEKTQHSLDFFDTLRGDVGIAPYAKGEVLPFNRARPKVLGVPSTPGPAGPPSPSRRGQGIFPAEGTECGDYRLLVMLPIGDFSRGFFHRLLHSCGKGL